MFIQYMRMFSPSDILSLLGVIIFLVFYRYFFGVMQSIHAFIYIPLWLYLKVIANQSYKENIILMICAANFISCYFMPQSVLT